MHLGVLKDQYNARNQGGVDFHLKLTEKDYTVHNKTLQNLRPIHHFSSMIPCKHLFSKKTIGKGEGEKAMDGLSDKIL